MDNLSLYCGILISMSSRDLKREREIRIFVVGVDDVMMKATISIFLSSSVTKGQTGAKPSFILSESELSSIHESEETKLRLRSHKKKGEIHHGGPSSSASASQTHALAKETR